MVYKDLVRVAHVNGHAVAIGVYVGVRSHVVNCDAYEKYDMKETDEWIDDLASSLWSVKDYTVKQ